ncbi:MAG: iron(III) transport system ATP-binding protein [Bacillota bacterium]|nr:MAG: iron(III) transport system ATP-binding protein [Bacillota bacterium]
MDAKQILSEVKTISAIELNLVVKTYLGSSEPAVKGISLSVDSGSIVTLLGPSGCGKTTTLRLIAGFERADSGEIKLAGKVVSDMSTWVPPERRGIGMVFQDYALFPHLNVRDNIGFGCKSHQRAERIREILALVDLTGLENRYPHELSGGQQQRVALGRALAPHPVVVLLDEPFSNLDADLRAQMRLEVKQIITAAGATAVLVTHDQRDALSISDQIVVMRDGRVEQIGSPRDVYQHPESRFVAMFVGDSNIIPGIIGPDTKSIETTLGLVPCNHTHDLPPGQPVYLSIRPESIELTSEGSVEGVVESLSYTGQSVDVKIRVDQGVNPALILLAHLHPEEKVQRGDKLHFRIMPDFVAVIREH